MDWLLICICVYTVMYKSTHHTHTMHREINNTSALVDSSFGRTGVWSLVQVIFKKPGVVFWLCNSRLRRQSRCNPWALCPVSLAELVNFRPVKDRASRNTVDRFLRNKDHWRCSSGLHMHVHPCTNSFIYNKSKLPMQRVASQQCSGPKRRWSAALSPGKI